MSQRTINRVMQGTTETDPNWTPPAAAPTQPTPEDVDRERDRRQALGLLHRGKVFQIDTVSRVNIVGSVEAAREWLRQNEAAIALDANLALSLRWFPNTPDVDMAWTAEDNTSLTMTASEMVAFGDAVAARIGALHFAARALKNLAPNIPADYATNSAYWPVSP